MNRKFLITGSFSAFIAVAAGAFGAHILKKHLEIDMLQVFETAVRYQMYHALALIFTGLIMNSSPGRKVEIAGWLFITGTVLFSGSLYILSTTGVKWLGAITPLGGIAFLAAWLMLILHFLKK